jgi:hypothetical protein
MNPQERQQPFLLNFLRARNEKAIGVSLLRDSQERVAARTVVLDRADLCRQLVLFE